MRYQCPCCGNYTLFEKPPGTDDICEVCFWHDDYVQFFDPDYPGGANKESLNEARANYRKIGAKNIERLQYVRPPRDDEIHP